MKKLFLFSNKFICSSSSSLHQQQFNKLKLLNNILVINHKQSILSFINNNNTLSNNNKRNKTILSEQFKKKEEGKTEEKKKEENEDINNTSKARIKKYTIIASIALALIGAYIEISYRSNPELSLGNHIRSYFYGFPFRNYLHTNNGVVLEMDNDDEEDNSEKKEGNTNKKLVYVSEEGNLHISFPEYFTPLGLLVNESSAFRDNGKIRITDIVGNDLIVEWNRLTNVLRTNGQSTMTPTEEALKACAYKYIEGLMERTDDVQIQRLEHIFIPHPSQIKSSSVIALDPLPSGLVYKKFPAKTGLHMVCVVSHYPVQHQQQGKEKRIYRADLWYLGYPYMYHLCLVYPEKAMKVANFLQQHGDKIKSQQQTPIDENVVAEKLVEELAKKYSNRPEIIKHIVTKSLHKDRITNNPEKMGLLLRNELIKIQHDSFCDNKTI